VREILFPTFLRRPSLYEWKHTRNQTAENVKERIRKHDKRQERSRPRKTAKDISLLAAFFSLFSIGVYFSYPVTAFNLNYHITLIKPLLFFIPHNIRHLFLVIFTFLMLNHVYKDFIHIKEAYLGEGSMVRA
jgi:hypothetical protein